MTELPEHIGRDIEMEVGGALICSLEIDDGLCGKPALWHVMWTSGDLGAENSLTCDEHKARAEAYGPLQIHSTVDSFCSLPGSIWVHAEGRCVIDGSGVSPVLMAGRLVSA
jgi:hypothetical protein